MFIIYAYLIVIFIRPQDWIPAMLAFPIADVVIGGGLLTAIFNLANRRQSIMAAQSYLLIFYLVTIFLSNAVHGNMPVALDQFMFFFKRAATFLIFLSVLTSVKRVRKTLNFYVFLSVLLVFQGIYQSRNGIGLAGQALVQGSRICWVGMWDGPNVLALVFVLAATVVAADIIEQRSSLRRAGAFAFGVILTYGIYLTNSRGGFIGLIVGIFSVLIFKMRNKKKAISLGVVIVFIFLVFLSPSRMGEIKGETSAHERTWIWERGLALLRSNPLLGIGRGQFHAVYQEVAHNNLVQDAAEMGFVGLFLFIGIMYSSFKGLFHLQKSDYSKTMKEWPELKSLCQALLAGLVAFNVTTFFITMNLDLLYVWWALCAVPLVIIRKNNGIAFPGFNKKDMAMVACIMIFALAGIWVIAAKNLV